MWPFARRITSIEGDPIRSLQRNNVALLRGVLTDQAKAEAARLARVLIEGKYPGEHLYKFVKDDALIKAVLSPPVAELAAAYFRKVAGTAEFFAPRAAQHVRHFDPSYSTAETFVPFHQDASVIPGGAFMLNCWTLLTEECGENAPGMDFLPIAARKRLHLEERPSSATYRFLETSHSLVDQHDPITPKLRFGDLLIFNEFAIHRTSVGRFTKARASAEIRLLAKTKVALTFYGQ